MKKYSLEIKWALVFTLVALLWMYLENTLGWHDEHIDRHATYTMLFLLPAIVVMVFALLEKRKSLGGKMTYKQGLVAGLIITLGITILSPLATFVTHTAISPDYFENAIAHAVNSGNATQEQAEKYFNLTSYMIQGLAGSVVVGAVLSALIPLVVRKA